MRMRVLPHASINVAVPYHAIFMPAIFSHFNRYAAKSQSECQAIGIKEAARRKRSAMTCHRKAARRAFPRGGRHNPSEKRELPASPPSELFSDDGQRHRRRAVGISYIADIGAHKTICLNLTLLLPAN